MLYLVVDYARPQDVMPALEYVRPGMLMIVILTAYLLLQGHIRQTSSKQTKMIWLFILLLCAYVPFAVNTYWAYITVRTMLSYMPFILSVIICINTIERLRTSMNVCIGIMIYIALYGILHKGMGSGNYFKDENDLSLYINMWLPFCFYFFITEKNMLKRIIYALGFILGLITVVVSFSRGGFVGLLAMFTILWLFSHRKVLTLSLIIGISLFIFILGSQKYWEEMYTVTDPTEGTATERLQSWQSGWDMFLDNPLGVGGNNFQTRFPEYQGDRFKKSMWGRVAHSLWFTLIPETGIVGIIIFSLLLYYNLKDIFLLKRLNRDPTNQDAKYLFALSLAMLASLAGFFASATFISVLYYSHFWYMTAFIVAAVNIAKRDFNKLKEVDA